MTERGRPIDKNRDVADLVGDRFYDGTACGKCGGTLRYTKGGRCVACAKVYNEAKRLEDGQPTTPARLKDPWS